MKSLIIIAILIIVNVAHSKDQLAAYLEKETGELYFSRNNHSKDERYLIRTERIVNAKKQYINKALDILEAKFWLLGVPKQPTDGYSILIKNTEELIADIEKGIEVTVFCYVSKYFVLDGGGAQMNSFVAMQIPIKGYVKKSEIKKHSPLILGIGKKSNEGHDKK